EGQQHQRQLPRARRGVGLRKHLAMPAMQPVELANHDDGAAGHGPRFDPSAQQAHNAPQIKELIRYTLLSPGCGTSKGELEGDSGRLWTAEESPFYSPFPKTARGKTATATCPAYADLPDLVDDSGARRRWRGRIPARSKTMPYNSRPPTTMAA